MGNLDLFLNIRQHWTHQRKVSQENAGYTLIELIVVVMMVAILAAIAGPSWITFVNQRRANAVNNAVYRALQEAQSQAKKTKLSHSVTVETPAGQPPRIAVYPDTVTPIPDERWKDLGEELGIRAGQVLLQTNLVANNQAGTGPQTTGTITFDHLGSLPPLSDPILDGNGDNTPEGLIVTVSVSGGNNDPLEQTQRCVKVLTLLGSLQTEKRDRCNFPT